MNLVLFRFTLKKTNLKQHNEGVMLKKKHEEMEIKTLKKSVSYLISNQIAT